LTTHFTLDITISEKGLLDIKRLNFGVITLVPKIKEANNVKQFRPICLLNVDFKCFTKVLTNRLVPIAQRVLCKNQTGFVKREKHFGGVVVLHEVIHELHKSNQRGLILQIDFEKAYDRVRWLFFFGTSHDRERVLPYFMGGMGDEHG
jgi:hypothetical protein